MPSLYRYKSKNVGTQRLERFPESWNIAERKLKYEYLLVT